MLTCNLLEVMSHCTKSQAEVGPGVDQTNFTCTRVCRAQTCCSAFWASWRPRRRRLMILRCRMQFITPQRACYERETNTMSTSRSSEPTTTTLTTMNIAANAVDMPATNTSIGNWKDYDGGLRSSLLTAWFCKASASKVLVQEIRSQLFSQRRGGHRCSMGGMVIDLYCNFLSGAILHS